VDKPFKKFEREVGALIGGRRHWSNSGEKIDCSSDRFVAQCKLVQRMSLEELTALVESIDEQAAPPTHDPMRTPRLGLVCVKVRRGKGKPSPTLVVMTSDTFKSLIGYTHSQPS
jgi:hypothetical protein